MSILNVNQIQPVGGGNTITVNASDVSASGATITASSFVGPLTGNVTGNITGTTSNASGATGDFSIADKIVHTGDTNTAIRFPAADTITAETGGTERLRIDSDGSAFFKGGSNGTKGTINIESNDPFIRFVDSNGTSDRRKWDIRLIGQSGYEELDFRAINDANSSFISKMQIEYGGDVNISDGNLRVANGHGIDFSATSNASGMTNELLDDYEEGNFTFTVTPGSGSYSYSYGQTGHYRKIGSLVFVNAWIHLSTSNASGSITFSGLPFNCHSTSRNWIPVGGYGHGGSPGNSAGMWLIVTQGGSTGTFIYVGDSHGSATTTNASHLVQSSELYINGCYISQ